VANAVHHVELRVGDTELACAVVVGVERIADVDGRVHGGVRQGVALRQLARWVDRPGQRIQRRAHARVVPARGALCGPAVVVGRIAADPHHPVHRAAAALNLAARERLRPAQQRRLRLRRERPVDRRARRRQSSRLREVPYVRPVVRPARLDQQHARPRVCQQPRSQRAPRRARSHDDVVVAQRRAARPRDRCEPERRRRHTEQSEQVPSGERSDPHLTDDFVRIAPDCPGCPGHTRP
jgi:hypothetical protein